jgi:hypothetical protein
VQSVRRQSIRQCQAPRSVRFREMNRLGRATNMGAEQTLMRQSVYVCSPPVTAGAPVTRVCSG